MKKFQNYFLNPTIILRWTNFIFFNLFYIWLFSLGLFSIQFLFFIPLDLQQGENFRIFFIHVPCAWLAVGLYIMISFFSVAFLVTHIPIFNFFNQILIKLGVFFSFFTLLSGSFWGKSTWGVLWAWDSRLTTSLILFLLFLLFFFMNLFMAKKYKNSFFLSFLILLGLFNIPILKFSVNWWNTLHQAQSLSSFDSFFNITIFLPLLIFLINCIFFLILFFLLELKIYFIQLRLNIIKKYINAYF